MTRYDVISDFYHQIQAAIALFDTDFNVEQACLKILESADNEADDDTWGKVEKPQKKASNREEKVFSLLKPIV